MSNDDYLTSATRKEVSYYATWWKHNPGMNGFQTKVQNSLNNRLSLPTLSLYSLPSLSVGPKTS